MIRRNGTPSISSAGQALVSHVSPIGFGTNGTFGGGERYPLELARAMARIIPTDFVTFGHKAAVDREGQLTMRTLRTRWLAHGDRLNPVSEGLVHVVARSQVVHVHQWESVPANLCAALGRPLHARVFATDHGGSAKNYWRRFRLDRRLTGFLPVSDFAATFYPDFEDRATTIWGGVDVHKYKPRGAAGDESNRGRHALFVGRLMPHKGVDLLIESLDDQTELVIVGRPYDNGFVDHLRGLADGKQVRFIFDADDQALRSEYLSARVLVLPSLHHPTFGPAAPRAELLGLTLIEAMASGTPVIATRTGGMPEVATPEGGGTVVEAGDLEALRVAVSEGVRPGAKWSARARRARTVAVKRFSWDAVARRCVVAYGRKNEPGQGNSVVCQ